MTAPDNPPNLPSNPGLKYPIRGRNERVSDAPAANPNVKYTIRGGTEMMSTATAAKGARRTKALNLDMKRLIRRLLAVDQLAIEGRACDAVYEFMVGELTYRLREAIGRCYARADRQGLKCVLRFVDVEELFPLRERPRGPAR